MKIKQIFSFILAIICLASTVTFSSCSFADKGTAMEINGVEIKVHSNGHKFYDIADKEAVDFWFETYGFAWFYGVEKVIPVLNEFSTFKVGKTWILMIIK